MKEQPNIISGGNHEDARGRLTFFNELDLAPVKRFYIIQHPDTEIVRAWQAHKVEQKWFYVMKGSFKIILVQPDDWTKPSGNLPHQKFVLEEGDRQIIHVPGGFASGFQAMEPQSELLVFSDFAMADAGADAFTLMRILGHSDIRMTTRYTHATDASLHRAVANLDANSDFGNVLATKQKRRT